MVSVYLQRFGNFSLVVDGRVAADHCAGRTSAMEQVLRFGRWLGKSHH